MKKVFRYQIWHLVSVIILITITKHFISNNYDIINGTLWGVNTQKWFWIAIAIPIIHQVYVWLIWRLELYKNTFSSHYGVKRAFRVYTIGFSILFISRLISIIILAVAGVILVILFCSILVWIIISRPDPYVYSNLSIYCQKDDSCCQSSYDTAKSNLNNIIIDKNNRYLPSSGRYNEA